MKTLRRVEVEPLNEQRWAKIERSVFTSLKLESETLLDMPTAPRRSVGFRFGLVAAAMALLCVSAAVILRLGGAPVVAPPSRIITGVSASHLGLLGVSLDIDPQSAVVVDSEAGRATLILLDRGSIVCEVAPCSHDALLIVQVGTMRVRVVGTRPRARTGPCESRRRAYPARRGAHRRATRQGTDAVSRSRAPRKGSACGARLCNLGW